MKNTSQHFLNLREAITNEKASRIHTVSNHAKIARLQRRKIARALKRVGRQAKAAAEAKANQLASALALLKSV